MEMRVSRLLWRTSPSHDAAFGQMRVATRIGGDPGATMALYAIASVNGIDGQMSIGSIVAESKHISVIAQGTARSRAVTTQKGT